MNIRTLVVNTDGGAIPGRDAVIGYVIRDKETKQVLKRHSRNIGHRTSNEAEFIACIEAFRFIINMGLPMVRIQFLSDSMLLVNQLSGNWRVKHPNMRTLYSEFHRLWFSTKGVFVFFQHVPRELNKEADTLARAAYHELKEPWSLV